MALNDKQQDKVYEILTEGVRDERATVEVTLAEALRRLLILARTSRAREMRLAAAVEALATNAGAGKDEILAAVNAALAAVEELDDDLPEGEEPPAPTA